MINLKNATFQSGLMISVLLAHKIKISKNE